MATRRLSCFINKIKQYRNNIFILLFAQGTYWDSDINCQYNIVRDSDINCQHNIVGIRDVFKPPQILNLKSYRRGVLN